jgi:hypothetical protein
VKDGLNGEMPKVDLLRVRLIDGKEGLSQDILPFSAKAVLAYEMSGTADGVCMCTGLWSQRNRHMAQQSQFFLLTEPGPGKGRGPGFPTRRKCS